MGVSLSREIGLECGGVGGDQLVKIYDYTFCVTSLSHLAAQELLEDDYVDMSLVSLAPGC